MEESASISSCPRTEGDGMECLEEPISSTDLEFDVVAATNLFPGLHISPLKDQERVITLIPQTLVPISKVKSSSVVQPDKKVKFVPYEPYKAAIKPIVPIKKKIKGKATCQSDENATFLQNIPETNHEREYASNLAIAKLQKEKEELESQLEIHSKINRELKKLLVASVGEDMEARVHFLTEDKIKLADNIRQYVGQIAVDFEQKEKLSIEADVWRSKFLASSVVIEELTNWKAALCNRNEELQCCVRSLVDEMNQMIQNHRQTLRHLKTLEKAFHPLGSSNSKIPESSPSDVVETTNSILNMVQSICKRLLGTYTEIKSDNEHGENREILSPAQMKAHEVLSKHPVGSCSMSEMTREVVAYRVSDLARRSLNNSYYTCCAHCTGKVHVV